MQSRARLLLLFLFSAIVANAEPQKRPNVVIIMADDLGYHDLSCYGHPLIKTPVLDKLAESGARLTHFYSGATVCTPSRMALLTGAYPPRLGWTKGVIGYMIGTNQGLSPEALTMAEVFKTAGYATGISGKWHLGDKPSFRPHRQGFDTAYYVNKSNNQTTQIWDKDEVLEDPFDNRLLTEKFTDAAKRFIQTSKAKPFFLYLPFTAPHFPVEAHPKFKGVSDFGTYGDVVEELDTRIGEILIFLDAHDLKKNTIVVFLSDNGPQPGEKAHAKPFRGEKWEALEGGTRVPCIISWPGVIPVSQEINTLMTAIDWLPTLAHACHMNLGEISQNKPVIDGINVWSALLGEAATPPRNDLLYWHGSKGFQSMRQGQWKLFLKAEDTHLPDQPAGPALFHLIDDPGETVNLAINHPELVQQMTAVAQAKIADIRERSLPLGEE